MNYYNILEIQPTATDDEIILAYKEQSFKWHPDRNPGIDTHTRMQEINEAKEVLLDPVLRAEYDDTCNIQTEVPIYPKSTHLGQHPLSDDIDVKSTWRGLGIILWIATTSYLLCHGCNN